MIAATASTSPENSTPFTRPPAISAGPSSSELPNSGSSSSDPAAWGHPARLHAEPPPPSVSPPIVTEAPPAPPEALLTGGALASIGGYDWDAPGF